MATLDQYAKLANDEVVAGLFEEIITADELMPFLQFRSFAGNSLVYNRELTLPASATHQVGDTWQDTEPTFTKKTASLVTVGVQSPLDRYISQTRDNVQDPLAVLLSQMGKSVSRKFADLIITGEPEDVTTEFEGLDSLTRAETRMMAMDDGNVDGPGTVETELTLDRLDAMIDLIENGKPHAIMSNKTIRRKMTALSRASGSGVVMDSINMFGHQIVTYNGIPWIINDFITNSEQYNDSSTWPSSTASSIFALKFGQEAQGFTVIHNGPVLTPDFQNIGIKENANENLYRLAFYVQTVTWSTKVIAALGGVDSAA